MTLAYRHGVTVVESGKGIVSLIPPDSRIDIETLNKVTGLTAIVADSKIIWSWDESDGAASYLQEVSVSFGPLVAQNDGDNEDTRFAMTGLTNGVDYVGRVSARSESRRGLPSDVIVVRPEDFGNLLLWGDETGELQLDSEEDSPVQLWKTIK